MRRGSVKRIGSVDWLGRLRMSRRPACGHPERIARRQAVGQRLRQRFKTGLLQHHSQRTRREVIAMRRDVIADPVRSHDLAIPRIEVRRLQHGYAARLQHAKGRVESGARIPLVLDVAKLRHDIEALFRQRRGDFGEGTLKDSLWRIALPCQHCRSRAHFNADRVEFCARAIQKSAVSAPEIDKLPAFPPFQRLRQQATVRFWLQRSRKPRKKHENGMLLFAASYFLVSFLEPIVVLLLRFVCKLVAKNDHAAVRASHNVPALAAGEERPLFSRAQWTRPQSFLRRLRRGTQWELTLLWGMRQHAKQNPIIDATFTARPRRHSANAK